MDGGYFENLISLDWRKTIKKASKQLVHISQIEVSVKGDLHNGTCRLQLEVYTMYASSLVLVVDFEPKFKIY